MLCRETVEEECLVLLADRQTEVGVRNLSTEAGVQSSDSVDCEWPLSV